MGSFSPAAAHGGQADVSWRRHEAADHGPATEEFTRYGIAGARIERVVEPARTNRAQLYAYFGSKEGTDLAGLPIAGKPRCGSVSRETVPA